MKIFFFLCHRNWKPLMFFHAHEHRDWSYDHINNTICNSSRHTYTDNMVAWHKPFFCLNLPKRTTKAGWVLWLLVPEKVRCYSFHLLLPLLHLRRALVHIEEARPRPRSEQHWEYEYHKAWVYNNSNPLKAWKNNN